MPRNIIDRVFAFFALVILSPVMLMVACVIRARMGSPVLFRQTRIGYKGSPFQFLKFRTMTNERDADGELLTDRLRITKLGRFLRDWSLDELPQLWNVLRGEMKIVGPRPLLSNYLPYYNSEQQSRHDVPPGITGWAQVNGRNQLSWDRKLSLDVWYVDHRSFWLDVKILFRTVATVISKEGIHHPGHATMPEFRGSGKVTQAHD